MEGMTGASIFLKATSMLILTLGKFIMEFKDSELAERAHMNLAYLYQDNKEHEDAIKIFGKVVELKGPKAVEAQFWIADSYYAQKKLKAAAAEIVSRKMTATPEINNEFPNNRARSNLAQASE